MIKFFSTKTGQSIGSVALQGGNVSLDPTNMRTVMKALADSQIGHLVDFKFNGTVVPAECLFGAKAVKEIGFEAKRPQTDAESSDFSPLG